MKRTKTTKGIVPYKPDLHELVKGKRDWSEPKPLNAGWKQRGYLPHRDEIGLTQLITFRLNDSLPAEKRAEWENLLKSNHHRDKRKKLEAWLDGGFGACHLRRDEIAAMVENAIRAFDGKRYQLKAWCIMPNHVHVLFRQDAPLDRIVHSWKSFTATQANRMLQRQGPFWAPDYWDTYMRDDDHEQKAIKYVEENPVNACLARTEAEFKWSSARFRDEYGVLQLNDR